MALSGEHLQEELQTVAQEVLGKLKSRRPFQSEWDTAAFIFFLLFAGECGLGSWLPGGRGPGLTGTLAPPPGTVLLLLVLACTHCCCRPRRDTVLFQKVRPAQEPRGVDNLALEP
ncbi:hypothetical protein MC885_015246 [Smutsia gigantea]|nr:hypothetical protein MC885_015246 [Smutsia gigantea]